MPSLRFKGRVFVENFHLGVPFHELTPVRARGLSPKASLHDNLIVEGDNLLALKALLHRWHHVPATAVRDLRIGRQTGTMILKEYQKRVLDRVGELVERLVEWRDKAEKVREIDPDFDWVRRAWEKTAPSRPYLSRRNGLREPLPSFCLKVPTGGGKTLLAIKVIDCVNTRYRRRQTGLVLWIVPSAQIYTQTQRALRDRDHPYRQQLDVASAGRTLVLEKTSGFGRRDVEERLCVLLLMLPSANRETKEQLRMFRDAGGFDRFFPPDDDADAHRDLRARVPNLDAFEQSGGVWGGQVKTSLGNALRLLRPLIVLDEGHKAYSPNARATLEGFNPCMIVELSATPPKGANVLVEISGRELNAEEMIKLDLHITNKAQASWQDTLLASIERREALEEAARNHEADSGVYIRPICLVQVERTGRDQRRAGVIHADDVRDYLLRHPRISADQVAVKTSGRDELKAADEAGGLLSRDCPIRFIITKQALQEGWDCSFAYVLAILTNPGSRSALTQLVGRILRQPYAAKTRVAALDESYVFCFRRRGADLLSEVRKGFGLEGLQGLEGRIASDEDGVPAGAPLISRQRERCRRAAADLVLPAFMIRDGRQWRLVHYETDILSRVPWDDTKLSPLFDVELGAGSRNVELRAGLDVHPLNTMSGATAVAAAAGADTGEDRIDYYFAAGHLLDAMPNPWRGAEAARRVFDALLKRYPRERVAANYLFVLEELRKQLEKERDRLSRQVFAELLEAGVMRFVVVADDLTFNRLPQRIEAPGARQANREDGGRYQHNLLDVITEEELNGLENKVATYLDTQARLFFWYRNRARRDYYVQGWEPGRIYADFILTLEPDEPDVGDEYHRVFVVETKGVHLGGSEDTEYKRSVFDVCSEHARKTNWAEFVPAMRNKVMRFEVVGEKEWEQRLNAMLAG
jgi:type III restriction enzyme